MNRRSVPLFGSVFFSITVAAHSASTSIANINIHLGASQVNAGKNQIVSVNDLLGARYTAINQKTWNGLFGFGISKEANIAKKWPFSYGVTGFYLFNHVVSGQIFQANLFNNLGYSYKVTNIPIYFMGKTKKSLPGTNQQIGVDIGLGSNIMNISKYQEWRINPSTQKDDAYKNSTNAQFSVTAGIALHFNNVLGEKPMECGYRFFYLGSSQLQINNNQYATPLSTGNSYANALACTLVI